ncbi:MAG: polysaccharide deacetylase family protein [Flavobacteriia bacterium]|nr:polysaccharide deacetylase family protein [Flavobacteriia bacterium]
MKHKINTLIAFLSMLILTLFYFLTSNFEFIYLLLFVLIIYLTILTVGVFNLKFNYFFKSISSLSKNYLYLTFDDGPHPIVTPKLLQILKQEGVKASFFVIGEKVEKYPELVKEIDFNGHSIGNHTYSHSNFIATFSTSKLKEDILKTKKLLETILGKKNELFRVPVGISNPRFGKVLNDLKLKSIGWSFRTFDTKKEPDFLAKRLNKQLNGGEIILFHDTIEENLPLIEQFIQKQKKVGNKFANLSEINS